MGIGGFFYKGLTADWSRYVTAIILEYTFYIPVAIPPPPRATYKEAKIISLPLFLIRAKAA
jgi:hypothetical protein